MVDDRPVSAVVADIVGNIEDIVRSEVRLASSELKTEALRASRAGSWIAAGLGFGLYAAGLAIAVIVLLLARVMVPWLAALVVCLATAALAAAFIGLGLRRWKRLHLAPEKTVRSVKENVSWMKAQIR